VTPFMTLVAGLFATLHLHTGQTDLVVGTDVANRMRSEVEPLIGLFVNLVVLRTDLGGDPSFQELLGRVREVALSAYAHQEVPFDQLVAALAPEREPGRMPLFQVLFVMQNTPAIELSLPGVEVEPEAVDERVAKFDLALFVEEQGEHLQIAWRYSAELFEPETMRSLAQSYERLLAAALAQPETRLSQLPRAPRERPQRELDAEQHALRRLKTVRRTSVSVAIGPTSSKPGGQS